MVVPTTYEETLERALGRVGDPFLVVERAGGHELLEADLAALRGRCVRGADRVVGYLPACRLEHLGDASFCADHGLRYPLCLGGDGQRDRLGRDRRGDGPRGDARDLRRGGAAAGGGRGGDRPARADARRTRSPYGFNLIHSPSEPALEAAVVDLYLRRGVRLVEASAYLDLTLPVVRYRVHGHAPRRVGAGRGAEPGHRQGVAGRGGVEVPGAAAGEVPPRAGRRGRDHARAGGVGRRGSRWPRT